MTWTLRHLKPVQVASCLTHNSVFGHGLTQSVEEYHQFVDVHVSLDGSLAVHCHDSYADEQVEIQYTKSEKIGVLVAALRTRLLYLGHYALAIYK